MSLLWRSLSIQYFRSLLLTSLCIMGILFMLRFDDIALFASLGMPPRAIAAFSLLHLPFLLSYSLPFSCLIASFISMRSLSLRGEITALRAAAYSLPKIFAPLLYLTTLASLLCFLTLSEWAPKAKESLLRLKKESFSLQQILQHPKKSNLHNMGLVAQFDDLSLFQYSPRSTKKGSQSSFSLFLHDQKLSSHSLDVQSSFFIFPLPSGGIIVEDAQDLSFPKHSLFRFLRTPRSSKKRLEFLAWKELIQTESPYAEGFRRISWSLFPLSLSFLGMSLALSTQRQSSSSLPLLTAMTLLSFLCFFFAKSLPSSPLLFFLYFLPHLALVLVASRHCALLQRGEL